MERVQAFVLSMLVVAGTSVSAPAARLEVIATASSSGGNSWDNTANHSGMSGDTQTTNDLHSTDESEMGLSAPVPPPHFVRYDLGAPVPLEEMWIWNYNAFAPPSNPPDYIKSMKDIVIEYSLNALNYTKIWAGTLPVSPSRGAVSAPPDLIVPFNAVSARFVRITTAAAPEHNYSCFELGVELFDEAGLAEVRFYKAVLAVSTEAVNVSHAIPVTVPGDEDVRYNLEHATSIQPPDWMITGAYVIGAGAHLSLYHDASSDSLGYIRTSTAGQQAILGVPNEANGWSTESVVSARASSALAPNPVVSLINGSGVTSDGVTHGVNAATMWLANQFNVNQRGGTVNGGHWVEFRFAEPYPIDKIQIWNYANDTNDAWSWTALGIKSATIQYTTVGGGGPGGAWGSENAGDWTTAFDGILSSHAPPHPPDSRFPMTDEIDFGGNMAQYVVLTAAADSNVNYVAEMLGSSILVAGLSEVRFTMPVSFLLTNPGDAMSAQTGFRFPSEVGTTYTLQRAIAGTGSFENTGAFAEGTGGEMTLFDPLGYAASNDYQVVVE